MNIKPTPELIEQLATQCGFSVSEHSIFANSEMTPTHAMCTKAVYALAELAATWGASQAQQTTADAGRVLEWMRTPDRKPANLAFTDGPERQAAYWIEIAQQRVAQQTTEPELPEPEAIRHSFDGYGYLYTDSGSGSLWKERAGCMPDAEPIYTAAQMHDHFAAGVRAGAAGSPWQPIDSAPQDGTKVLAYTNDGYKYPLVCQCVWGDGAWWPDVWESPDEPLSPTHWMPLPAVPKEQKQ